MKRFASFLIVTLLIAGFQPAAGQSFGPKMEVFSHSDSSVTNTLVIPKHDQFETGKHKELIDDAIQDNIGAIIDQLNNSGALIIYGTQDEQGSYIDDLGTDRARKVAQVISEEIWGRPDQLQSLTKVRIQELALPNDVKTGALTYKEELLIQRGVVLAFTSNSKGDIDQRFAGIEAQMDDVQQRVSELEDEVDWLWLLGWTAFGIGLLALGLTILSLQRRPDNNDEQEGGDEVGDNDGSEESTPANLNRRTTIRSRRVETSDGDVFEANEETEEVFGEEDQNTE